MLNKWIKNWGSSLASYGLCLFLLGSFFLGDHFLRDNGFSPCDTSQRDFLK